MFYSDCSIISNIIFLNFNKILHIMVDRSSLSCESMFTYKVLSANKIQQRTRQILIVFIHF